MNLQINKEWLLRMAEKEANGIVSAGGFVCRAEAGDQAQIAVATERSALAQLVELQRRKLRLSVEALAGVADIDVEEVLGVERGEVSLEPRSVFKLANALRLPADKLMHLAGHVLQRDARLEKAAVRFAAKSASIDVLTAEEAAALEEFVRVLGQ
jgi:transcriptional regulator with XRE-family HTH domain